ncbi:MAG: NADH-quinone oxidoreductase subunit NuoH [Proteobacteria bacterium]|nr:NADH-quinone oxidoreductase subunit NuoH [Pseudomonadota bacterium]
MDTLVILLKIILFIVPLFIFAGFLTYAERKVIAKIQRRIGPNQTGFKGLLQPYADIIKLVAKEIIIPKKANKVIFFLAPLMILIPALLSIVVIPASKELVWADLNLGLLYILAISSLGIFGMLLTAWGSNSNYALLGGIRGVCQVISYEIPLAFVLLTVALLSKSMNLNEIVTSQSGLWNIMPLLPIFPIFIVSIFAKTHRTPFDLPEAENELVAGFNVEYSSTPFAMIFLGEYINLVVYSALTVVLFFGGWLPLFSGLEFIPPVVWFTIKTAIVILSFFFARATLPRVKFDRLLSFSWKVLIPISMAYFVIIATYMQFFRSL